MLTKITKQVQQAKQRNFRLTPTFNHNPIHSQSGFPRFQLISRKEVKACASQINLHKRLVSSTTKKEDFTHVDGVRLSHQAARDLHYEKFRKASDRVEQASSAFSNFYLRDSRTASDGHDLQIEFNAAQNELAVAQADFQKLVKEEIDLLDSDKAEAFDMQSRRILRWPNGKENKDFKELEAEVKKIGDQLYSRIYGTSTPSGKRRVHYNTPDAHEASFQRLMALENAMDTLKTEIFHRDQAWCEAQYFKRNSEHALAHLFEKMKDARW